MYVIYSPIISFLKGDNCFLPEYFVLYILSIFGGFIIGGILSYFFAKMSYFGYKKEIFTFKQLLPCAILWGIIFSGITFMSALIYILSKLH